MGGNGSTNRKVSFGMDEDEKVTVIEGVKVHLLLLLLLLHAGTQVYWIWSDTMTTQSTGA